MEENKYYEFIGYLTKKYNLQKWFGHLPSGCDYAWQIIQWINNNIDKSAKIVELGCGIGHNIVQLNEMGYKNIYGIEKDENTYLAAQEMMEHYKCSGIIYNADANNGIPSNWNNFDIIIPLGFTYFKEVNHIELFNHCVRRLNKNGYLILDVVDPKYNPEQTYPYYNRMSRENLINFAKNNELIPKEINDECYPKLIGYFKKEKTYGQERL